MGGVDAFGAVPPAKSADVVRYIIEEIGGTVLETSIVAYCHEVGSCTLKTGGVQVIPAVSAGDMATRTVHGDIGIEETFIA